MPGSRDAVNRGFDWDVSGDSLLLTGRPGPTPMRARSWIDQPPGRFNNGAGEGNRTLVVSLEGFCSTIELHPHIDDNLVSIELTFTVRCYKVIIEGVRMAQVMPIGQRRWMATSAQKDRCV